MNWYFFVAITINTIFIVATMLGIGKHAELFGHVEKWMKIQEMINDGLIKEVETQAQAITQLSDELAHAKDHLYDWWWV